MRISTNLYPDRPAVDLRERLARHLGLTAEEVAVDQLAMMGLGSAIGAACSSAPGRASRLRDGGADLLP